MKGQPHVDGYSLRADFQILHGLVPPESRNPVPIEIGRSNRRPQVQLPNRPSENLLIIKGPEPRSASLGIPSSSPDPMPAEDSNTQVSSSSSYAFNLHALRPAHGFVPESCSAPIGIRTRRPKRARTSSCLHLLRLRSLVRQDAT